jgi:hypothetical protein
MQYKQTKTAMHASPENPGPLLSKKKLLDFQEKERIVDVGRRAGFDTDVGH